MSLNLINNEIAVLAKEKKVYIASNYSISNINDEPFYSEEQKCYNCERNSTRYDLFTREQLKEWIEDKWKTEIKFIIENGFCFYKLFHKSYVEPFDTLSYSWVYDKNNIAVPLNENAYIKVLDNAFLDILKSRVINNHN